MRTCVLALAAILAVPADKPIAAKELFKIEVVNGMVSVSGKDFQAVAQRAEYNPVTATLTLEGRPDDVATVRRLKTHDGEPKILQGRKVIMRFADDSIAVEGALSIGY